MRLAPPAPSNLAPRLSKWTTPDGHELCTGDEFRHAAHPRKRWVFVAFVDDGDNSHIEAVRTHGPKSVRALRPEGVTR